MTRIIKHETYVEATAKGLRFVVDAEKKSGKYMVIIQGKQFTTMHDGEEFVNLNLSWLYVDEAAAKYGSFITEMADLASKLKHGGCGSCGKVLPKEELSWLEGSSTCGKCIDRKINWEINFNDTAAENRKNAGMEPSAFIKYPSNDWKYYSGIGVGK